MAKQPAKTTKIKVSELKTRDPLIQKLIAGATKAGVHKDEKKEANKKKCRQKVEHED